MRIDANRVIKPLACALAAVCLIGVRAHAIGQQKRQGQGTRQHQVTRASWYGQEFAGRRTAGGERFNPEKLTAAHPTLPFGTWVRVTDLHSKRSVVVQITDRGPYHGGRGIDLSHAAARQLGMVRRGVSSVRIEVLEKRARASASADKDKTIACRPQPWILETGVEWRTSVARYDNQAQRSELRS
jgi:rare lipoprotein A (peptidoglycan hydrolase)